MREALLRMVSIGLIVQQPRRGLLVSNIDLADHLDVILTRRVLEGVIAACSARRATAAQRKAIVGCAAKMIKAAERANLEAYMAADHELDLVNHEACRNSSAVKSVVPLIVQCRRFWYAYQHEGEIAEGRAASHGAGPGHRHRRRGRRRARRQQLMDYLEGFARRVIEI